MPDKYSLAKNVQEPTPGRGLTLHARFLDAHWHASALNSLAAAALQDRSACWAYLFADRRCRIKPLAGVSDYLLRADALMMLGDEEAAHRDILTAYAIEPGNSYVRQRLQRYGIGDANAAPATLPPAQSDIPPKRGNYRPAAEPSEIPANIDVTVIVPVYSNLAATRNCLESLARNTTVTPTWHAVIVNDNSPDGEIDDYLDTLDSIRFSVVRNASNLGFSGAVNRALKVAPHGDVLVLNADTVINSNLIARLHTVARSSDNIGTLTPLSNNGEYLSYPLPNTENAMPNADHLRYLDEIAAAQNMDEVIDVPSGIGFCLYITRACLDAISSFSADYGRGYLEDADFCLRARAAGFRSVGATGIFVGHIGSQSFGAEKRQLVFENIATLRAHFPEYEAESAAFIAADPLRIARGRISRCNPPVGRRRLVLTGTGAVEAAARHYAGSATPPDVMPIMAVLHHGGMGPLLTLDSLDHSVPQGLEFDLATPEGRAELDMYLGQIEIERIVFADPANIPLWLAEALARSGHPVAIHAHDGGLICPGAGFFKDDGQICDFFRDASACKNCKHGSNTDEPGGIDYAGWRNRWRALGEKAVEVSTSTGASHILSALTGLNVVEAGGEADATNLVDHKAADSMSELQTIVILPTSRCADSLREIMRVLGELRQIAPDIRTIVAGTTLHDLSLMALGNAFVSGPITADELPAFCRRVGSSRLIMPDRQALFGHPVQIVAAQIGLPTAFFDWSFGLSPERDQDLRLDPRWSLDKTARAIAAWCQMTQTAEQQT
jgi:O-antigen biosynthesis protein